MLGRVRSLKDKDVIFEATNKVETGESCYFTIANIIIHYIK